jgi:hypothetical protein
MTDVVDGKFGFTRLEIFRAADHEFGDILTYTDATKGAMYPHLQSKNPLAKGICRAPGGACRDLGRPDADAFVVGV